MRFEGMWIMKLERWKQAVDGPLSGRVRLIVEGQEVILEAGDIVARNIHEPTTARADPLVWRGRSRSVSSTYCRDYACFALTSERPRRASVSTLS